MRSHQSSCFLSLRFMPPDGTLFKVLWDIEQLEAPFGPFEGSIILKPDKLYAEIRPDSER